MAMAEENTSKLDSISDRLGNIEQILRSNSETQTVYLRSICELLQKLVTNSMQENPKMQIQGEHLMNKGGGQVGRNHALLLQGSTPPTPSPPTEKQQPYRLVIEGAVGTKKENSDEYYVTRGKEISIKVSIMKLDGTPVRGDDPHASVTVELVVLAGGFYDPKVVTRWDKEAFEKSKNSLEGMTVENSIFELNDGSAVHGLAKIIKNSGKKEVKLGVMIHEGNMSVGGRRVFEGVSNPFKVKEPPRPLKNPEKRATDSLAKEERKRQITETSSHRSTNGPAQSTNLFPGSQKQISSSHAAIAPTPKPSQQHSSNNAPLHLKNQLVVPQGPNQSAQLFFGSQSQIQKMSSHPAIVTTPQHGPHMQIPSSYPSIAPAPQHGQQQSSNNAPLHLTPNVPTTSQESHMPMMSSHQATTPTPQHVQQIYNDNTVQSHQMMENTLPIPQGHAQSTQYFSGSQMQKELFSHYTGVQNVCAAAGQNRMSRTELQSSDQEQWAQLLTKAYQQVITPPSIMQPGNETGDHNQPGPSFANLVEVVGYFDDCPSQDMECQPSHQASSSQAQDQTMSAGCPYDSFQHGTDGPAGLSEQFDNP